MKPPNPRLAHANGLEAAAIGELQRKAAAGTIGNEELLRLGLLQLEPAHDAIAAVETLKQFIARDPKNDLGRVWLAYICVFELMELREAVRIADEVSAADQRLKAAALWLKGAALRELDKVAESIAALEGSVRLEPAWVANRLALANAYRDGKQRAKAIAELKTALANVESAKDIVPEGDLFDTLITGRAGSGETVRTIEEEMARVSGRG